MSLDPADPAALHANELAAMPRIAGLSPVSRQESRGPWWLLDAGLDEVRGFNTGIGLGPPLAAADLAIAALWFGDRPHRLVARADADRLLVAVALDAGYVVEEVDGAFALHPLGRAVAPPAGVEVAAVSDPVGLAAYGAIGWGARGLQRIGAAIAARARALGFDLLLARADGEPCACALAAVTGPVVGVYNVAVEPRWRRRGIGSAMTAAALEAGRRRGAVTGYLRATPAVAPVYERLEFTRIFDYVVLRSRQAL